MNAIRTYIGPKLDDLDIVHVHKAYQGHIVEVDHVQEVDLDLIHLHLPDQGHRNPKVSPEVYHKADPEADHEVDLDRDRIISDIDIVMLVHIKNDIMYHIRTHHKYP